MIIFLLVLNAGRNVAIDNLITDIGFVGRRTTFFFFFAK